MRHIVACILISGFICGMKDQGPPTYTFSFSDGAIATYESNKVAMFKLFQNMFDDVDFADPRMTEEKRKEATKIITSPIPLPCTQTLFTNLLRRIDLIQCKNPLVGLNKKRRISVREQYQIACNRFDLIRNAFFLLIKKKLLHALCAHAAQDMTHNDQKIVYNAELYQNYCTSYDSLHAYLHALIMQKARDVLPASYAHTYLIGHSLIKKEPQLCVASYTQKVFVTAENRKDENTKKEENILTFFDNRSRGSWPIAAYHLKERILEIRLHPTKDILTLSCKKGDQFFVKIIDITDYKARQPLTAKVVLQLPCFSMGPGFSTSSHIDYLIVEEGKPCLLLQQHHALKGYFPVESITPSQLPIIGDLLLNNNERYFDRKRKKDTRYVFKRKIEKAFQAIFRQTSTMLPNQHPYTYSFT